MVQIPFNVFDQKLLHDGMLEYLKGLDVEVHARSIFLQGLLLMQPKDLDDYFLPFLPFIEKWHEVCSELGMKPLDLALHFAASQPLVDKIIVGISNLSQLKDITSSLSTERPNPGELSFPELAHSSDSLTNPALWNFKS